MAEATSQGAKGADMRWFSRGGRRVLAESFVQGLWRTLVAYGAAYHPIHLHLREDEEPPRQRPAGPPPAHPERLREEVPLSEQELRILRELWPARFTEHSTPEGP